MWHIQLVFNEKSLFQSATALLTANRMTVANCVRSSVDRTSKATRAWALKVMKRVASDDDTVEPLSKRWGYKRDHLLLW